MKLGIFSIEELMQTPLCMMTGEQFAFLASNLSLISDQANKNKVEAEKPKHLVYGIKGIADIFGCSIPTANRIKRGENGGYPPTKNGDIRSLLCA